jgi:hypothetical protein
LKEKDQELQFEEFPPQQLDAVLGRFYLEARTTQGELYRGKSLQALRYGLNRHLQAPPHNRQINILKDKDFNSSNQMFFLAMQELKAEGKADVKHTNAIEPQDLRKLYSSKFMSPDTPTGLLNKVQFDIRFYFFRRGLENMEKMTKTTFEIKTHLSSGKEYITKRQDELTKNHRVGDEENVTGVILETGTESCPVRSFRKYTSLLNPKNERLWQYPVNAFSIEDAVWYTNKPIGLNSLKKFMMNLSKLCCLSEVYTNHSIRATGATILADRAFSPIDIMSVTGHKSVCSLKPYQKTSLTKKMEMASVMASQIDGPTASGSASTSNPRAPRENTFCAAKTPPSTSTSRALTAAPGATLKATHSGPHSHGSAKTPASSTSTVSTAAPGATLKATHSGPHSHGSAKTPASSTSTEAKPTATAQTSNARATGLQTTAVAKLGPAKPKDQDVTAQSDLEDFPLTQEDIEALLQPDDDLDTLPTERGTAPIFSNCNLSHATINIVIRK